MGSWPGLSVFFLLMLERTSSLSTSMGLVMLSNSPGSGPPSGWQRRHWFKIMSNFYIWENLLHSLRGSLSRLDLERRSAHCCHRDNYFLISVLKIMLKMFSQNWLNGHQHQLYNIYMSMKRLKLWLALIPKREQGGPCLEMFYTGFFGDSQSSTV